MRKAKNGVYREIYFDDAFVVPGTLLFEECRNNPCAFLVLTSIVDEEEHRTIHLIKLCDKEFVMFTMCTRIHGNQLLLKTYNVISP